MAKLISRKDVVGKVIYWGDSKLNVVGVVNDFLYNNMYSSAPLLLLYIYTASTSFLNIRMQANANLKKALPQIENIIKKDNPGYPVEYKFVDDSFGQGFVFGTTDEIRRLGQKPNKEPKIQTTTDDKQRNVGLTTEAQKRTEVAADRGQPCWRKTPCYVQTLLCRPEPACESYAKHKRLAVAATC